MANWLQGQPCLLSGTRKLCAAQHLIIWHLRHSGKGEQRGKGDTCADTPPCTNLSLSRTPDRVKAQLTPLYGICGPSIWP